MNSIFIDNTIILDSNIQNVSVIEKLIDNYSSVLKFNDELYGKLLLAVVEAVNNAIVHGNHEDESKKVSIHYVFNDSEILFTVTDEGEGFDPSLVPDPTAIENLEKDCGRGIYLMNCLCDEILFQDGGRTVMMKFSLS